MTKAPNVGISPYLTYRVREGETCPVRLERGKNALVRLGYQ